MSSEPGELFTEDLILGGKVRLRQPSTGFRSGIEPVLLAAAVPAVQGEHVLEAGSGTGAALLCLAARVAALSGLGIERDPALAAMANRNAAANGSPGLSFQAGDILEAGGLGEFDHALANPPYHREAGTRSPDPAREQAKRGRAGLLAGWAGALSATLRHHGTLTFVIPVAALSDTLAAMDAASCRPRSVLPLWPRLGRPAKLALVQGVKQGKSPLVLLPGLILHAEPAGFTPAADAVLRGGEALPMV